MSNKPRSLDVNRDYPCSTGRTHQEIRPTSEIDASVSTNPVDQNDSSPKTKITTTNRHKPQVSKHTMSISDNGNGNATVTPEHTNHKPNPSTPRPHHAGAKTSKKPWSPPGGKYMATIRDTAIYHEHSPTTKQTKPPTEEKKHEARPLGQPKDRDTSDPETKFHTRHAPYQRCTIIRPHATTNRGEFHTNRDVNLVPDRGKEPNETITTEIKHEEPPPELNDFVGINK